MIDFDLIMENMFGDEKLNKRMLKLNAGGGGDSGGGGGGSDDGGYDADFGGWGDGMDDGFGDAGDGETDGMGPSAAEADPGGYGGPGAGDDGFDGSSNDSNDTGSSNDNTDSGWTDPDPSDFTGPGHAMDPDDFSGWTPGVNDPDDGWAIDYNYQTPRDKGTHGAPSSQFGYENPETPDEDGFTADPNAPYSPFRNVPYSRNPNAPYGPQTLEDAYRDAVMARNDGVANDLASMMSRTELANANKSIMDERYDDLNPLAKAFLELTFAATPLPSPRHAGWIGYAQGLAGQAIGLPDPGDTSLGGTDEPGEPQGSGRDNNGSNWLNRDRQKDDGEDDGGDDGGGVVIPPIQDIIDEFIVPIEEDYYAGILDDLRQGVGYSSMRTGSVGLPATFVPTLY